MNRKQFIILVVLVAVIGAAGMLVYKRNNSSWQGGGGAAAGQKLLPNLPVNDVAQIVIKSGTNELNLARKDNLWRVHERGDYPASFQQIGELVTKVADLKVVQNEDIGPSQLGRLELLPPGPGTNSATSMEFKDQGGKSLGLLLLGKKHMKKPAANAMPGMGDEGWPDGRYVKTSPDASSVVVISDPLESVQPKPEQWLDKTFLNVDKPRSISAQFPQPTNSWTLTRASETNDWQLADARKGEKLDSSKISSVTSPFSAANFNDVARPPSGSSADNTVLTVQTFDGFSYVAKIGAKLDDNVPVSFAISANFPTARAAGKDEKPEEKARLDKEFQEHLKTLTEKFAKESAYTNWVYQMPSYSLDEILKTRGQLLEEEKTNSVAAPEK